MSSDAQLGSSKPELSTNLRPVSLLFTDIAGSTRLWRTQPEHMRASLARHDQVLRETIQRHGGKVFKTVGDAFFAVFETPEAAVGAALDGQQALHEHTPDLRVRMAVHTGEAEAREGDYFGPPLNHVARLLAAGHGGQILVSLATCEAIQDAMPRGAQLRSLGTHRLRDIEVREHIFQVDGSRQGREFPPLNTENVVFQRGLIRAGSIAMVVIVMLAYLTWQAVTNADKAEKSAAATRVALGKEEVARGRLQTSLGVVRQERNRANREARRAVNEAQIAQTQRNRADLARRRADLARDVAVAAKALAAEKALAERRAAGRARRAEGRALTEAEKARGQLFIAQMSLMQQAWDAGNIGRARELLAAQIPPPGKPDYRDFAWRLFSQRCASKDLATLEGHNAMVSWIDFSRDGKTIASGGFDRTIRLWNSTNFQPLKEWEAHKKWVTCVGYSPDGRLLASSGDDGEVKIWDATTRGLIATYACDAGDWPSNLAWTPDGKYLVWGTLRGMIYSLQDGQTVPSKQRVSPHTQISVVTSPNSRWVYSVGFSNEVAVVDLSGKERRRRVPFGSADLMRVAVSPNGNTLALGTFTGDILLADLGQGKISRILKGHRLGVAGLDFSSDGQRLVSGGFDQTVRIWQVEPGVEQVTLTGHGSQVGCVRFAPGNARILTASADKTIKVWGSDARPEVARIPALAQKATRVATKRHTPLAAMILPGDQTRVHVWNMDSPADSWTLPGTFEKGVGAIALSPEGELLALGIGHQTAIWDLSARRERVRLNVPALDKGLAFSPDGRFLASTHKDSDEVIIHDRRSWRELHRLRIAARNAGAASHVEFTPDSASLVVNGMDGTIRVCDVKSGVLVKSLRIPGSYVWDFDVSPNGDLLAVASLNAIQLWDLKRFAKVAELTGHKSVVVALKFTPSGRSLLSASEDQTIKCWNVRIGQEIVTLKGVGGQIQSLNFVANGFRLLTVERLGEVRLYEAAPLLDTRGAEMRRTDAVPGSNKQFTRTGRSSAANPKSTRALETRD